MFGHVTFILTKEDILLEKERQFSYSGKIAKERFQGGKKNFMCKNMTSCQLRLCKNWLNRKPFVWVTEKRYISICFLIYNYVSIFSTRFINVNKRVKKIET